MEKIIKLMDESISKLTKIISSERKVMYIEKNFLNPNGIIWDDVFGYVKNLTEETSESVSKQEVEEIVNQNINNMSSRSEEYLKENVKEDDWNRIEEGLNDSLWTNNVIKYMDGYLEQGSKMAKTQRLIALQNSFNTIDAFIIPSATPDILEKYEEVKIYLIEMYGDKKATE